MTLTLDPNRGIIFPDASIQPVASPLVAAKNNINALIDAYDAIMPSFIDPRYAYVEGEHTFTNNNLTLTRTALNDGNFRSIFSTPIGIHDRVYYEITLDVVTHNAAGGSNVILGWAQPELGVNPGYYPGHGGGSLGLQGSGWLLYYGNSTTWPAINFFQGHTVGFAFDAGQTYWWWRNITTGQPWQNGAGVSDPGGFPVTNRYYLGSSYLRAPNVCVGIGLAYATDQVTVNFQGPFVGTPPNGHRRWNGTLIPGVPL
jgi:hypothetical protein